MRFSLLISFFVLATARGDFAPRVDYGALLEPPEQVIHGAGQSQEISFANYVAAVGPERHPAMYMPTPPPSVMSRIFCTRPPTASRWSGV